MPSTEPANSSVRATAASLVTSVLTSSTSGSTGTGLKKCRPSTRCGFLVAAAIFMIGMLDVFDASTAFGSSMTASSSEKISALTASSSMTASITSWRSDRSFSSVVNVRLLDCAVPLALGDLARADAALERLDDAVAARGDERLGLLEDLDVDAGARGHLCDTGAHLTGTDDTDPGDRI